MKSNKFRSYNKTDKKFYYFLNGGYFNEKGEIAHRWCFNWENAEQFTGLHDKNGKEIYFNDFVKAPSGNVFQVIWYDEEMRIALKFQDTIYNFNVALYEVCSNKHEGIK